MAKKLTSGYLTLILIVVAIITVGGLVGQKPFLTYFSTNGLSRMSPALILPPLIWLAILTIRLLARGNSAPLKTTWRTICRHRWWLTRGALFTFLALPLGKAFGAFKSSIPNYTAYWADPALANLDRLLFFGNDPWTVTHFLFGPTATLIMDRLYVLWFLIMIALFAWLNFTRDPKLQLRGLLTYMLSWSVLGMAMAMAIASVGPVYFDQFYGSNRFAELTEIIRSQPNLKAILAMDYLYESRGREEIGNGISAMPSMHVANAWLFFLVCRYASVSRILTMAAAAFFAITFVASIHLGWHYFLDGFVSMICVSAIWGGAGIYVEKLSRSAERSPCELRTARYAN